jgi:Eco57I restriction-modification methylase
MPELTEWTFAADVAKWMTIWLHRRKSMPFVEAKVEQRSLESLKRRDLSLLDRDGKKALTGEIRFPDARDGQTPYNAKLVTDARRKAHRAGAPFFFTWNVNRLVLWPTQGDHEVGVFDVVRIRRHEELEFPVVERHIRDGFIPYFLEKYAAIYKGAEETGVRPLDQRFISRLESALQSIANIVFEYALEFCKTNRKFKKHLDAWMKAQEWLLSDDEQLLIANVDRATRLACYITSNKLVFYQALRRNRRFRLRKLEVPSHVDSAERLHTHFRGLFEEAKIVTRDYQTIFDGGFIDRVPFITDHVVERWRALVKLLNDFDFRQFGQDVIGHIFEDLLSPEERHRWGQHYTRPAIVDVINAFCIRHGDAIVLDPASGSGTFPVRAYVRKKHLSPALSHAKLLEQLYACEISEYAAHLTALNLATRDLIDGENFPRVARRDFFESRPDVPFCSMPDTTKDVGTEATEDIYLSTVDAVTGNPPYLRQEDIAKNNKKSYSALVKSEWPGLKLSGRSDLHVYFWPHASKLLTEGGYFGFLTSASWLDVEYGFHLQRWILQNFELVAVLESICEPWFTGARVATAVTILRRCSNAEKRAQNLVRFVQLRKPLRELLANDGTETGRQEAAERLRDLIESTQADVRNDDYRILTMPQQKLWDDGCRVGKIAAGKEEQEEETETKRSLHEEAAAYHTGGGYLGGKWGVYLRAPDLYFELINKHGDQFAALGQVAAVRYGFKSGCDDYFCPVDISADALQETDDNGFRQRYRCRREEVLKGAVSIIRAGDGSEHPIETEYLKPEVHSLMTIDSVQITASKIKRRILLVDESQEAVKHKHVFNYIRYGQRETFGEETPVSKRETCGSRTRWYDICDYPKGTIILPIIVQYRHIVSWNPEHLPVNHALMVVECRDKDRNKALAAVLNSTLVAFIKPYFSRKLGNEANTQLDVYAANMLPIPNVAEMSKNTIETLADAFDALGDRAVTQLVEQRLLNIRSVASLTDQDAQPRELPLELQKPDRQALDKAVLKTLGIPDNQIGEFLDRLYREVTLFWNSARMVEIQAMENRKRAKKGRVASPREVAHEIFESFDPAQIRRFPEDFLPDDEPLDTVELPEGKANLYDPADFYDTASLAVGSNKIPLRHRPQAELAKVYADLHRTGFIRIPVEAESCDRMRRDWEHYASNMQTRFRDSAIERTEDEDRQDAIVAELNRLLEKKGSQ